MRKYCEIFFMIFIGSIIGMSISTLLIKFNANHETLYAIILSMSIIITALAWSLYKKH